MACDFIPVGMGASACAENYAGTGTTAYLFKGEDVDTTSLKVDEELNQYTGFALKEGKKLVMNLGYSHQVIMEEKNGVTIEVPAPNKIIVSGIDKQSVGQFAAEVREKRPPEPYKGKGIRYAGEVVRRKEGKTGGKKK